MLLSFFPILIGLSAINRIPFPKHTATQIKEFWLAEVTSSPYLLTDGIYESVYILIKSSTPSSEVN